MRSFLVGSLALLLGLCACATASTGQLSRRAAFDLQCSQKYIVVHAIDEHTRGVRGCQRQATYVQSCRGDGLMEECTWVLNGGVNPVAP